MSSVIFIQSIEDLLESGNYLSDVSFAVSPPLVFREHVHVGVYSHHSMEVCICIPYSSCKDLFLSLFENTNGLIYVHAFKELCKWFAAVGIELPIHRFTDVSVAAYLIDPPERDWDEDQSKFLLTALIHRYLGGVYPFLAPYLKDAHDDKPLRQIVCEDARLIRRFAAAIMPKIAADSDLRDLFTNIEMPLIPVLAQIERDGIGLRKLDW